MAATAPKSVLVVLRANARKPNKISSQLTNETPAITSKHPHNVSAHVGNRYGPMIGFLEAPGTFHAHDNLSAGNARLLQKAMIQGARVVVLVMEDARQFHYCRKARLELEVSYTPDLAQHEKEQKPEMHLYLSTTDAKGVTIIKDLDEDQTTTIQKLTMEVNLTSPSISDDCLLNVQMYAQYLNTQNQWCLNQCGYANFALSVFCNGEKQSQVLRVYNSDHPDRTNKGRVEVRFIRMTNIDDGQDVEIPKTADISHITQKLSAAEAQVKKYTSAVRNNCYSLLPAASDSIENVTVFRFQTQTHGYVMGPFFDVFRIPTDHEDFMMRILQIGKDRSHAADGDKETAPWVSLLTFFTKASRRARLKVIMWALAVYVTSCLYITDEVDDNHRGQAWTKRRLELIESFDDMIVRDAGDCEDFARAMLVLIHTWKERYSSISDSPSNEIRILNEVAKLLNCFVFCSALCGVSSAALNDLQRKNLDTQHIELNGHEAAFAIPRLTWMMALARHDPEHPIVRYMQQEREEHPEFYCDTDIIYPLEGTGVLNPEPSHKNREVEALEKDLQKIADRDEMQTISDARTMFTYEPHGNNFYKMIITLMTPEFLELRGVSVIEFVAYETNVSGRAYRSNRHIGKRGVWFDDLLKIAENPSIKLFPCPEIDADLENACSLIVKDNYPLWKPYAILSEIPQEWKDAERALCQVEPRNIDEKAPRVTYFIPACLITSTHVEQLKELAKLGGCQLSCRLEAIRQNPNGHKVANFSVTFIKQIS